MIDDVMSHFFLVPFMLSVFFKTLQGRLYTFDSQVEFNFYE